MMLDGPCPLLVLTKFLNAGHISVPMTLFGDRDTHVSNLIGIGHLLAILDTYVSYLIGL